MSGVRNLRAMFEQRGENNPPDRGRSPGLSVGTALSVYNYAIPQSPFVYHFPCPSKSPLNSKTPDRSNHSTIPSPSSPAQNDKRH
ncbi:hypothetical protein F5B20DRAFT_259001 [Whalleya microplaca]|nr:hypothetical protein F5B20DRAFT_259001 [Whalleya microplaca]